jgi:hypothetical protein
LLFVRYTKFINLKKFYNRELQFIQLFIKCIPSTLVSQQIAYVFLAEHIKFRGEPIPKSLQLVSRLENIRII